MSTLARYEIGYNRPIEGATGNSPVEWHSAAKTDDIEHAKEYCKNVRDNGHSKAIIFDTQKKCVIEF